MRRRIFVILLVLSLTVPVFRVLSQSNTDKQTILAQIQQKLGDGNSAFSSQHYDDAVKDYQAALDLVNQHKDDPVFANSSDLKQLQTDEFQALVELGQSTYYKILPDDERNGLNSDDLVSQNHADQVDQIKAAMSDWQEAITIAKAVTVRGSDLGMVYIYLGRAYRELTWSRSGNFNVQSQQAFASAIEPFKQDHNSYWEERALFDAGFVAYDLGTGNQTDEGVMWDKTSLKLLRQAADVLVSTGTVDRYNWDIWNLQDALFRYSQQVEDGLIVDKESNVDDLLREILHDANVLSSASTLMPHDYTNGMWRGLANSRLAWRTGNPSLAISAISDVQAAIDIFTKPPFQSAPQRLGGVGAVFLAYCQFNLGRDYLMINQPAQAVLYLSAAQSYPDDGHGSLQWKDTLSDFENDWLLGKSLSEIGRYTEAIQQYEKVSNRLDLPFYPDVQLGMSQTYEQSGDYEGALTPLQKRQSYYENALKTLLAQPKPDPTLLKTYQTNIVDNLVQLGVPLIVLGRTEEALTYLQQALDQATKLNNNALLVSTLLRTADIYLQLGNDDNALANYTQAVDLAQKANLTQQAGQSLLGLGQIQLGRGLLDKASTTLNQASQAAQNAQDVGTQVQVLIALGNLALKGQKPDMAGAERNYQQALLVATKANDSRLIIMALIPLGDLQGKQNNQQAVETYHQALAQAELINNRDAIALLHGRLGQALSTDGQVEPAILNFNNALDVVDETQRGFRSAEVKSEFAANYAWIYADDISLLFAQKRYVDAFGVAERARARTFLDQLAEGPVNLQAGATADEFQKETSLRQQIDATNDLLLKAQSAVPPDRDYIQKLQATLQSAQNDYTTLFNRLQAENPTLATLTGVQVATVDQVQAALDADTTLLSYYTTTSQTYLFIITAKDFSAMTLDVKGDQLRQTISHFRADETQTAGLADLYKWLIAPVADQLHSHHLLIVPHGVLNYLPFAALMPDATRVLGDQFAISYLPSATSLLYLSKGQQSNGKVLALGNPVAAGFKPLPFAEDEVQQVVTIAGGQVYTGQQATKQVVLDQASSFAVLYLAAHGTFNPRNPLFSALHLSTTRTDSGTLAAYEIYSLDLTKSTQLVVLSACETAVGTLSAGDEFSGLNRAFLYAGAPAVIASLWSVDDKATSLLMVAFFKAKVRGLSNVEALQAAQQAVRTYTDSDGKTPYTSPYYWAAFVLTGRD